MLKDKNRHHAKSISINVQTWSALKTTSPNLRTRLWKDHSHMSVNDMWVKFKTGFVEAVERFIPSKMTKTKYSVPWIDATIKRLVKNRHRLTFVLENQRTLMSRFITSGSERMFIGIERCLLGIRFQYIYVRDPDTAKPEKIKKFWSFIKSLKKDAFRITSLRENEILKIVSKEKAKFCKRQFQ